MTSNGIEKRISVNEVNRRFLQLLSKDDVIGNLSSDFTFYTHDGLFVLTSVSWQRTYNCYVVSPVTQASHYAIDEINKINSRLVRLVCRLLVFLAWVPLRMAKIDNLQVMNNQCLSTNLYAERWNEIGLRGLREEALHRYPKHAILLRSLNLRQNGQLISNLLNDGWISIVSRQVYLISNHNRWLSKRDSKKDIKLLQEQGWDFVPIDHGDMDMIGDAKRFYDLLYLEKYSRHNIQYSQKFLSESIQNGLLKLFCLRNDGKPLGVIGFFQIENALTIPIIGYDTSRPVKLGLYRRLVAFGNMYAKKKNLLLNQSSGAPDFKRVRGAEPEIEYSYVYTSHLPLLSRFIWKSLSVISNTFYKPLLQRFEL